MTATLRSAAYEAASDLACQWSPEERAELFGDLAAREAEFRAAEYGTTRYWSLKDVVVELRDMLGVTDTDCSDEEPVSHVRTGTMRCAGVGHDEAATVPPGASNAAPAVSVRGADPLARLSVADRRRAGECGRIAESFGVGL